MIHFNLDICKKKLEKLEEKTYDKNFWNNKNNNQEILQEIKNIRNKIDSFNNILKLYEDLYIITEIVKEDNLNNIDEEYNKLYKEFIKSYENFKIQTLLKDLYDKNNAILTLHAGAGGTEACDWVKMLLRMYTRWAQNKGYTLEILDYLEGEEVGTKSVTIQINGENAFGYLKGEKGIHRLVRISPFDAVGKRHTSFASCDVMPEIDDNIDVEISTEDLRIDTYRASGAGGQHVNKTESAIRITHIPSNITVQCQSERSQHKNKDRAMKILKGKIYEKKMEEQKSMIKNIRGEVKDIGWGNQIRSYIFHPYSLVKDHRTNIEIGNIQSVIDGNIDIFINSYLKWINNINK